MFIKGDIYTSKFITDWFIGDLPETHSSFNELHITRTTKKDLLMFIRCGKNASSTNFSYVFLHKKNIIWTSFDHSISMEHVFMQFKHIDTSTNIVSL